MQYIAFFFIVLLLPTVVLDSTTAVAAQVLLTWVDTTNDEDGFRIERKRETSGVFAQIATVGSDTTSYTDSSVTADATYCYRVKAYNWAIVSPKSNEVCLTVPGATATLTVSATGSGTVTGSGINCGTDCSETYASGAQVTLTATPHAGSTFTGWSGDLDCGDGMVTMNVNKTCSAAFASTPPPPPPSPSQKTLSIVKQGSGTVKSTSAGIRCGAACSASYPSGATITLTATPSSGFVFAGWNGGGCSGVGACTLTLTASTTVTAIFRKQLGIKIGVFRPSTGQWFLDLNGNGQLDTCSVDVCVGSFGTKGSQPVVGDWVGNGSTQLGVFTSKLRLWQFDLNGNDRWDGCAVDLCIQPFMGAGDVPVIGRWQLGAPADLLGIYRPSTGLWRLDLNGNVTWDTCNVDGCSSTWPMNQRPVVGDWSGDGVTKVGLFDPATGRWRLDRNGNRKWEGCTTDNCLGPFGMMGDLPVVGDWDGTGKIKLGVFDPSTGMWELDLNGNGTFDGCAVDQCLGPFGKKGDLPVVGMW